MKETGDTDGSKPCQDCKVNAELIKKLDRLSKHDNDEQPFDTQDFSKWNTHDSDEILDLIYSHGMSVRKVKSTTRVPPPDTLSDHRKSLCIQEKYVNKDSYSRIKKKKKCNKIHQSRIEELSVPRRVREKVELPAVNRVLLPFNETSTFSSMSVDKRGIAKIALQYRKNGNKTLKYVHGNTLFPCLQGEEKVTKFACQRKSIERSLHDFILSKSQSQSTSSLDRISKMFETPILAKTREQIDDDDRFSNASIPSYRSEPDLPLPQTNYYKPISDRRPGFDAFLPPVKLKKSQLGSITAISDGNRKVGIKSNSIKKLGRHPKPRPPQILPRLAGSKVEVPLFPRSPDFLYRIL